MSSVSKFLYFFLILISVINIISFTTFSFFKHIYYWTELIKILCISQNLLPTQRIKPTYQIDDTMHSELLLLTWSSAWAMLNILQIIRPKAQDQLCLQNNSHLGFFLTYSSWIFKQHLFQITLANHLPTRNKFLDLKGVLL